MSNRVRLNIELPASVRDSLKAEAALRGIPLRELVLEALGVRDPVHSTIPEVTRHDDATQQRNST